MYDIEQLELQWRRYRLKRILIPAVSTVVVLGIVIAGYAFWPVGVEDANAKYDHTTYASNDTDVGQKKQGVSLGDTLSTEIPSVVAQKRPNKKQGWHMTFADSDESVGKTNVQSEVKHVDIQVSSKKTEFTVKEIESRFHFAKDKDDALFLARYYFDKKKYKQALKWALETNKLDSDIEESWLLFGRSKAKLGQRMEAIRVLQAYYDRTGSKKAKALLDKVRRGKNF
jgi:tetratricopeptide (TPR) repeat protein